MNGPRIEAVHQVLPSLHVADASGAHTLHARAALRAAGYRSDLFVTQVDAELAGEVRHVDELWARPDDGRTALLYQLAVGSPVVDQLVERDEPLMVNYHNLTPASFFWQWAPEWLEAVASGRDQLHQLAPHTAHAIAVSAFNELDLLSAGYRSTSVVPPFVDVAAFASSVVTGSDDAGVGSRGARWLFVGKLLPHKSAHDLVRALAAYRHAYDPEASLVVVGGHPVPAYSSAVQAYADALGLRDAVTLAGSVSAESLAAAYSAADVFVCLSRHEGFCFPLLEAMHHRMPVVALDAGGGADTLGTAGVVLRDASPPRVAAAVARVLGDRSLLTRSAAAAERRLAAFGIERTAKAFVDAIRSALGAMS
ncbi:MAG: glycosyltransferase family 4 protein [Acidimicrobiales bacterium]